MPRGAKRKHETRSVDERASKKRKLVLQPDPREENQLPDELVLQLFRQLERADVIQCAQVCRQWYRVGQRDEFCWTFVAAIYAVEYPHEYHFQRNKKLKYLSDLSIDEQHKELEMWQSDPLRSGTPVRIESDKNSPNTAYMYDDQDILVAIAQFNFVITYDDLIAKPPTYRYDYDDEFNFSHKNNKLLWRYTIEQCKGEDVEARRKWKIRMLINLKMLDTMILEQNVKVIPNEFVLLKRILDDWWDLSVEEKVRKSDTYVNRPLKSNVPKTEQPSGFKDIKLFNYQLDAIAWMKSIENEVGQALEYSSVIQWQGSAVYFDSLNKKIVHPHHLHKHFHKEKICGGILADAIGLGKSIEVLGLVLAAPSEVEPQHSVLIASKSTLLMCPEYLCQQWYNEIVQATTLSPLVVQTYEDLKHCTYEDFRTQYDVIVFAYELLSTPEYANLPIKRRKGTPMEEERNENIQKALKQVKAKQNFSGIDCPILEHFFFHRVVYDESHLLLPGCYRNFPSLKNIQSFSRWCVSATPFGDIIPQYFEYSSNGFGSSSGLFGSQAIVQLLYLNSSISNDPSYGYLEERIFKDFFWRNTKDSIGNEFMMPKTIDDGYFIEFSPIEHTIYSNPTFGQTGQYPFLECSSLIYEHGFLDEVKRRLHRMKQQQLQSAIDILEQEIQEMPEKLIQAKSIEEKQFISIQQLYGSKVAAVVLYLKKLFQEQPNSRTLHAHLTTLLNELGIKAISVDDHGKNLSKAVKGFKDNSYKVLFKLRATGLNFIEATHVLLLDYPEDNHEVFESQAIGQVHRQGQKKQVTIARFLFKGSFEHQTYLRKMNITMEAQNEHESEHTYPLYKIK